METKEFVMVGKEKFVFDPSQLQINEATIKKHLSDQASQYYNISFWAGKARSLVDRLTADLKILEAELDDVVRENLTANGVKVTEAKVKASILSSESYKTLTLEIQAAQASLNTIQALQGAYLQRKDLVVEMARHLRSEMDISGGLRV